jgi:exopolysaccharide production protein ExoY
VDKQSLDITTAEYWPVFRPRKSSQFDDKSTSATTLKRIFDISAAAAALILMFPLLFLLTIGLLVAQGRPILVKHERVGRGGKLFGCLKFRTMVTNGDEVLRRHLDENPAARVEWETRRKIKDDPRVTPVGQVLRKTSIDELPQLLNIFRGDMSVVGPRPIVEAEMTHYGENIGQYLSVRPGLTGLWQVSGRSDVTYASRVELDSAYVAQMNFVTDLTIILKTVPVVLGTRGSY